MNRPGVPVGNWQWRFQWDELDDALPTRVAHLVALYGRKPA
jgi:4-alpha-glucanotransferase